MNECLAPSGMSGHCPGKNEMTGQCKPALVKVLGWCVRCVRGNFYYLTYAPAREAVYKLSCFFFIYYLGSYFLTGQAGQRS